MVNDLVVNFYRARVIRQMTSDTTLADLRLRLDFKAREVRATIFNSIVATGSVRLRDNTAWVDIDDNLFVKHYVGAYNDMNYATYVLGVMLNVIAVWAGRFYLSMPTPSRLASPNAPSQSPFLPPAPPSVSASTPITNTIVGDFFALLDDWARNNGVSFIEFEIHHEAASIVVRWDRYTIYITPDNALVVDGAGNALTVSDPDGYYSVTAHLNALVRFGNAFTAVYTMYGANPWPYGQVGPTVFEYVLNPNAETAIVSLKYQVPTAKRWPTTPRG
ncbi:hypothetical protein, partial [Thermogladius sp.]|uniref:hypothetical protein n=1 Tax=Thermogladius sp. TaxID=2023064 RepID=UPI003D14F2EB